MNTHLTALLIACPVADIFGNPILMIDIVIDGEKTFVFVSHNE